MKHSGRSREHLLHILAEAAELEHNLLCSYLYAALRFIASDRDRVRSYFQDPTVKYAA